MSDNENHDWTAAPPPQPPAPPPAGRRSRLRPRTAAVAATVGLLGGGMIGGFAVAHAATASPAASSSPTASTTTPPSGDQDHRGGPFDPTKGGHVGANGVVEQLLTGDTATKVRDAAQAAVPGGTIERVENDAEGSPYEAHMVKSDGTHVTVKVDASFNVTTVETDQGPGGHGGPPPQGQSGSSTATNQAFRAV